MSIPPFNTYLGTEIVRRDDGEAEVRLVLQPHHLNRRGVVHGGVVGALLDSALGAAVISAIPAEWWCATISLATQFVDGATDGATLSAVGRVVRRGGRVAFATGEVRDDRDRLIATASGSWHLWPHRPGGGARPPERHLRLRGGGSPIVVGKILAVGRNYAEHVAEMGAPKGAPPVLFLKPSTALVPGGGRLELPGDAGSVHHEVELVAVIGRGGRGIPASSALDHVLGYAVGLDMTLRDLQAEAKRGGAPWSEAKGFDGSAPVSLVAPREEIGDGSGLAITLDVDGERRQQGSTSQMIRPVAELVAQASRFITLEPGDLLFTGTPAGVGPVVAGNRLVARIERVGELVVEID